MLVVTLGIKSNGQSTEPKTESSFGINVNPAYYFLGGYSIRGIYHLPQRWSLGLNVEGGFELPDDFRDAFFDDNQNIDVNWDYAVGLEARYRFSQALYDRGFYAFGVLGYEGWTIDEIGTRQEDSLDNWFASIGVGFNWYPFPKKGFNVGLNYNIIFILNNTDDRIVGDTRYNISGNIPPSIVPSNINIGWRFD